MYNYGYKSRRIVLKISSEFALDRLSKMYLKYDDSYLTLVYYTV